MSGRRNPAQKIKGAENSTREVKAMSQFKLLIVDDEQDLVAMVGAGLQRQGCLTFGATDGIKAVEVYYKERPDIVFIDIHMPFSPIDGIETLKRIKGHQPGC